MLDRSDNRESALYSAIAARLPESFPIDDNFRSSLRALRLLLHIDADRWQMLLVDALLRRAPRQMSEAPETITTLRSLVASHGKLLARMRLDQEFVGSLAELAAHLALCRIPVMGILGGYSITQRHFLNLILADDRLADRLLRREAYLALTGWISLETGLLAHFLLDDMSRIERAAIDGLFSRLPVEAEREGQSDGS